MLISEIKTLIIVLILECIISITNIIIVGLKKKTKSSMLGKIKTWIISIAIIIGYMNHFGFIDTIYVDVACIVTIIMQILVAVGYIRTLVTSKVSIKKSEEEAIKNKGLKYVLFDTDYYMEKYYNS